MFESCYTPDDVAHVLRNRHGLPVELEAYRPTIVSGSRIGAISLPMELGYRVLNLLPDRPVPVVGNPPDTIWTFLVGSVFPPLLARTVRRWAARGVTVHARGHRVLMPMSDSGLGWRWACAPEAGPLRLPSRGQVLDAAELLLAMGPVQTCREVAGATPDRSRSTT
ncbi:hypothetical protein [Nocardia alni]|uniref:hypothetical protein n=1 Tax=Nocardia alni TaxID=2815723 RepID=UPI001C227C42|nr:hypothetical protein [Nocardia alni]